MSYSFWDGVGDLFSGGGTSLVKYATGKNAIAQADPLHLFTDSKSDKLAKKTFDAQQYWNMANYKEQQRQYDENLKFQQEAYNYQRELNAMQMEREDTAVQRRVADLQSAGLSPTLAAGSAASSTPVHAANAPQGTPAQMNLPSDIRVQHAMFKEGLMKDQMQLAMSVLGNIADISRTKAETELIKAQKDRYVAETPIELRLKTLLQEQNEKINPLIIEQTKLNMSIDELKKDNQVLNNAIAANTVAQQALDLIIKQSQADNAGRKYKSEADKLEEEVKEKSLAVKLAEHIYQFEENTGVPISAMSPVAKTFIPIGEGGKRVVTGQQPPKFQFDLESSLIGKKWNKLRSVTDPIVDKIYSFAGIKKK